MRIGIYNPYFESGLGGGERYVLTLASHWAKTHTVEIFCDNQDFRKNALILFRINLSDIKITHNFFRTHFFIKKLYLSNKYDLIFFLSDGSIPSTLARYNILHFQVPFSIVSVNPLKMSRYSAVVCNSYFTKNNLPKYLKDRATVIYPPVDVTSFIPLKKEMYILSVGRFSAYHQAKKQEVLLQAFSQLNKQSKGVRLILVGGLLRSDQEYFDYLKKQIGILPVDLLPNADFVTLQKLYGKSMLYWHAAGFGEISPCDMEHFGISIVEAMSSGAVPLVFNGGGLTEIIDNGENGYLWDSPEELVEKSLYLMKDVTMRSKLQKKAIADSQKFSKEIFTREFDLLLRNICEE